MLLILDFFICRETTNNFSYGDDSYGYSNTFSKDENGVITTIVYCKLHSTNEKIVVSDKSGKYLIHKEESIALLCFKCFTITLFVLFGWFVLYWIVIDITKKLLGFE